MTNRSATPNKRQGRIHYTKVDNPYPLEMIQQGIPTLELLTIFPCLTSTQVARALFLGLPNSQGQARGALAAQKAANHYCLRRLKDLRLVAAKAIARVDNPLSHWEVNHLTTTGYRVLKDHRERNGQPAPLPFPHPDKLTYTTVHNHHMAVTDVGISAIAACLRQSVTIERYWDDMTIRSLSKTGKLHWPMEPDALIILRRNGHAEALLVEVDLGTESVESARSNSFSTKLSNYKTYFKSQRATDPLLGGYPQPQVLIIAPSQRRLQNLQEATAKSGGRSSYWFTTQELLQPPYSFFDGVWQRIGLDSYHSLMERFPS